MMMSMELIYTHYIRLIKFKLLTHTFNIDLNWQEIIPFIKI